MEVTSLAQPITPQEKTQMLPHGEGTAMALSVLIMMWLRMAVGGGGGSDMYVKQTWTKDAFHKSDCISVGWFVLVSESTNYWFSQPGLF